MKKYKELILGKQARSFLLTEFADTDPKYIAKILDYIDKKVGEGELVPSSKKSFQFWLSDVIPVMGIEMNRVKRAEKIALQQRDQERERKKTEEQEEARKAKIWEAFNALSPEQQKDISDRAFETATALDSLVEIKRDGMMHRSAMSTIIQSEIYQEEQCKK